MISTNKLGLTLGLALAVSSGCADVDESELDEPSVDVAQESVVRVSDLDCSFCNVARDCCNAVNAANGNTSTLCNNFNAARCETLDPGRQYTIIQDCLVNVNIRISAWRLAGREPPPECHVP
ncbi:MAG TPA: hypothetical protein VJV78_13660 [Polyangiales bacterium]|nr:hypothetical protein [Polyangiales bacterium]